MALGCTEAAGPARPDSRRATGSVEDAERGRLAVAGEIETALADVGLPSLALGRPTATLSGGQRTPAVAGGACLVEQPDMLLLDELDQQSRSPTDAQP